MDTKTELLNFAERAVRERGFDGFSYADIAKDVGIRKASIHHHYPAKADLGIALIERYRQQFFDHLSGINDRHKTAGARLNAYVTQYKSALTGGNTLCLCVALAINRDRLADPILLELNQFHEDSVAWLLDVFALGKKDKSIADVTDPTAEAAACLALVEGAQLVARAAKSTKRFDRATAQLKNRLT